MSNEKMVYVPRNWKVSYVDEFGNEHNDVEIRINSEYAIVSNGEMHYLTVAGIRVEAGENGEEKKFIIAKVLLYPGTMNVIKKAEDVRIDLDTVTSISTVSSNYRRVTYSNRNKDNNGENVYTFAFDTEKYSSKYKISINAGEFVSLAVKDINDPNKKSRSFYGHIISVDSDTIKFSRYVSNKGVRDVYTQNIPLASLLGVYRYALDFESEKQPEPKEE